MIKTSMIAACVVALSVSAALAQGATRIVDEYGRHYNERGDQIYARGNVPTSQDRSWRSSTIPSGQAQAVMAPSGSLSSGHIIDEYGRHYNERGDRIR